MARDGGRTGSRFGPYQLQTLLGKGGMGEVYEAHDTVKDRVVALKLLPETLAGDQDYRERFRREARTAARLQEPHVIPIHDFGEIDGVLFIDMRLVRGRDLRSIIKDGPLGTARSLALVSQVASALDAAHADGLVHRDIKPENVMVTPEDFAYLADFGIAATEHDTRLTGTGSAIGSIAYMAPERFREGAISGAADIYSLGCLLHECLTGQTPYHPKTVSAQIAAHLYDPPPAVSQVVPGIPAGLDDVLARALAKQPEDRYTTAGELAAAARAATSAQDQNAATTIIRRSGSNAAGAAGAAAGMAAASDRGDGTGETGVSPTNSAGEPTRATPLPGTSPYADTQAHSGAAPTAASGARAGYGSGPYPAAQHGAGQYASEPYGYAAGGYGGQPPGYSATGPTEPEPRGGGAQRAWWVAAACVVLAAVVVGAILVSQMRGGGTQDAAGGTTSAAQPKSLPPDESGDGAPRSGQETPGAESGSDQETEQKPDESETSEEPEDSSTSDEPEDSSSSESSESTTSDPGPELSGSGFDRQGWTHNDQARCNADDPAKMVAHSTKSYVVICARADNGAKYYRAYRTTDGSGIEIAHPTRSGGGWHVTNKGTDYYITRSSLRIVSPSGKELANEAMGTYEQVP